MRINGKCDHPEVLYSLIIVSDTNIKKIKVASFRKNGGVR